MAQHFNTKDIQDKAIKKIEAVILRDFARSRGLMKSSLKYQYIGEQEGGRDVFIIHKNVPKKLVLGGKASFEIHQDIGSKKVEDIYLVA